MTLTRGRPKGISARRLKRVEEEVAPLIARGLTQREIAKRLNISHVMAAADCRLVQERWVQNVDERLEVIRGELIAKHDEIYKIAMQGYGTTGSSKMLDIASKELECLGRLLGQAGPSINLHNHQHNVAITSEAVGDLFKPLDAGSYAEMVASKALPPTESKDLPVIEMDDEQEGSDEWVAGAPVAVEVIEPTDQPKPARKARPYPFRT